MTAQEKAEFEERIVNRMKKEVAEVLRLLAKDFGSPNGTYEQNLLSAADRLTPKPEPVKVPEVDWKHYMNREGFFDCTEAGHWQTCSEREKLQSLARLIVDNKLKIVPVAESEK